MISEKRKKQLRKLIEKSSCAGDLYYVNMSKEDFEKEMSNCKDEDIYEYYSKQRKLGYKKYQGKIIEKFKEIESSEELHYIANYYNYDNGSFTLEQVINHKHCDIKTAQMIYWLLDPIYYYDKFDYPSNCPTDNININWSKLISKIEEKAIKNKFKTELILDDEDKEDYFYVDKIDFEKPPYNKIPQILRECLEK